MAMTFFGAYRGPAWETTHGADVAVAAAHGVAHPADAHAHGQAAKKDHEVSHGKADTHDDHGGGHGHGAWHGPHESPAPMTFPLRALAIGAIVAGFIGIPGSLWGPNTIEHFLEPSFTAQIGDRGVRNADSTEVRPELRTPQSEVRNTEAPEEPHVSLLVERGLMFFSVLVALAGILAAQKFYVKSPEISEQLAERFAGPHRLLSNKYYVDELYNATVIRATLLFSMFLSWFDANVIDGLVNLTRHITLFGFGHGSNLIDKYIVDGAVNGVAYTAKSGSAMLRRMQSGLVQNYALVMGGGVVLLAVVYLFLKP